MSRLIDRIKNALRGGGAEHPHSQDAQPEPGAAPGHDGEQNHRDDSHDGEHEQHAHKHC